MTEREAYPSVEAMLEPSVLGGRLGRPVASVVLEPMERKGWSSTEAGFEAVLVDEERTPAAVVKRIRWSADWLAIATDDAHGRELAIWESGVLDRLPPQIGHGVLAAAPTRRGSPRPARCPDRLPTLIDPGVARDLHALSDDPAPIVAALARFPVTLLHGDLRNANVAWDGQRAIPVDWQPTVAPPRFDCAYFVWSCSYHSPFHPDQAWLAYRDLLRQAVGPDVSWDVVGRPPRCVRRGGVRDDGQPQCAVLPGQRRSGRASSVGEPSMVGRSRSTRSAPDRPGMIDVAVGERSAWGFGRKGQG